MSYFCQPPLRSYKQIIDEMHYLNDDFSDTLTHFSAATERYRINSGTIRMKMQDCKRKLGSSRLYDFKRYDKPPENY